MYSSCELRNPSTTSNLVGRTVVDNITQQNYKAVIISYENAMNAEVE